MTHRRAWTWLNLIDRRPNLRVDSDLLLGAAISTAEYMALHEDTAALNRITIQTVGSFLGLRLPPHGHVRCPLPDHDDSTPSFQIKKPGNRWKCYGCQRYGGPIDFVRNYHCMPFLEAKRWLADHVRVGRTPLRARGRHATPNPIAPSSLEAVEEFVESPPDHELYDTLLQRTPLQPSGMQYLLRRGLSTDTISRFRIGQLSDWADLLTDIIDIYGYQRVRTAGLLTKSSTIYNRRFIFPRQSILFPFYECNHVVYFQARCISGSPGEGKWRNLNHRQRRIYNCDAMFKSQGRPIAVCEGAIDSLSAIELGYDAVGLMGVNMGFTKDQIVQLRGRQVHILLDWDSAGDSRSIELQKELRRYGIASTRKRCPSPGVNDVNDYLVMLRTQA